MLNETEVLSDVISAMTGMMVTAAIFILNMATGYCNGKLACAALNRAEFGMTYMTCV